jgi:hypothetical protein
MSQTLTWLTPSKLNLTNKIEDAIVLIFFNKY